MTLCYLNLAIDWLGVVVVLLPACRDLPDSWSCCVAAYMLGVVVLLPACRGVVVKVSVRLLLLCCACCLPCYCCLL
ncbi:hypothetical protein Dimus_004204 [Dionaea muscipula]